MKAIILAAGMGTRLEPYTKDLPKCMLKFQGKTLLSWQIKSLKKAGFRQIVVVGGYRHEKLDLDGAKKYVNPDFATTNMVATLMTAENEFKDADSMLVCYADILFEPRLVQQLMKCDADVTVLADENWLTLWKARSENWENDVESLSVDQEDRIIELGTPTRNLKQAPVRFVGLMRFNQNGIQALIRAFNENKAIHGAHTTPWRNSKSFNKAYMTCMLQELIERKLSTKIARTRGGWIEFDTTSDYEKALTWAKDGTLHRFIDMTAL